MSTITAIQAMLWWTLTAIQAMLWWKITAMQAMLWWVFLLPIITLLLAILLLRKAGGTAEINVIWYAFSLVFVIWWCVNAAITLSILDLSSGIPATTEPGQSPPSAPTRMLKPEPGTGLYYYIMFRGYLTDFKVESVWVAAIVIIFIAPQLLSYFLSGLSGCASTPKYVWPFEKVAIWSSIKFLAALGGLFAAEAVELSCVFYGDCNIEGFFTGMVSLLQGLTFVAVAFILAVLQVYFLVFAEKLRQAREQEPGPWPIRAHRFFTRKLLRDEGTA